MSIGYACQTVGVPDTTLRSCIMKHASEEKLIDIISNNLKVLENILDYNATNEIHLFRISSDLIPFGSSPVNTLKWWDIFKDQLALLADKISDYDIRVSMHPGQYTVLNSPNIDVVDRAILDLTYHCKVLDSLKLDKKHKLVLHIGGVYQDKEESIKRFITAYRQLDQKIKDRLVLENDDKLYHIKDVLKIAEKVGAPIIFDNLHHRINPPEGSLWKGNFGENNFQEGIRDQFYWIEECKNTWKKEDGKQKMHYSEQNPDKKPGSHSDTINAGQFKDFFHELNRKNIDIMLEVKDKNLSAVKCINAIRDNPSIRSLELEWSKYKYLILEKSHEDYNSLRRLLKDKDTYPVIPFYHILDNAMQKEVTIGEGINAAQHVWGYFKDLASDKEKKQFHSKLEAFREGELSLLALKRFLWRLTLEYQQDYLYDSYYFSEVYDNGR